MICPKCGAIVPEDGKFCPECGIMISERIETTSEIVETPTVATCPKCGTVIPEGANFCEECGFKLNGESAPEKAEAPNVSENKEVLKGTDNNATVNSGIANESTAPIVPTEAPKGKDNKKTILIAVIAIALVLIVIGVLGLNKKNKVDTETTTNTTVAATEITTESTTAAPSYISPSGRVISADNLVQGREFNCTVDEYIANFNNANCGHYITKEDFYEGSSPLEMTDDLKNYVLNFTGNNGGRSFATLYMGVNPVDNHVAYISYVVEFPEYTDGIYDRLLGAVFGSLGYDNPVDFLLEACDYEIGCNKFFQYEDLVVVADNMEEPEEYTMRPMTESLYNRLYTPNL